MRGFLWDTNVLSELRKGRRCDAGVRDWIDGARPDQLFVSVLVLGEIRKGIERIRTRDQNQVRALEKCHLHVRIGVRDLLCLSPIRRTRKWSCRLNKKRP